MINSKADFKSYLLADRSANSIEICGSVIFRIKRIISPDYICNFLILLRKLEYIKNCKKSIWYILVYNYYLDFFRKLSLKLSFSIPLNVFGPGLSIPHCGTIIVNPAAKIGENCRPHAGVNIGSSGGSNLAPKIGDNVYIGLGVILFGDIKIADNITIGANAAVNISIEVENTIVGGTPAKILKNNTSVWWVKNRLNLEIINIIHKDSGII
jgi:serine O-acetyltransferase